LKLKNFYCSGFKLPNAEVEKKLFYLKWMPYQYDLVIGSTLIVFIPLYIRMLWRTYKELFLSGKNDDCNFTDKDKRYFILFGIITTLIIIALIVRWFLYKMLN